MSFSDKIVNRLMNKAIAEKGYATIEEAQFFRNYTSEILDKLMIENYLDTKSKYNHIIEESYKVRGNSRRMLNESTNSSMIARNLLIHN